MGCRVGAMPLAYTSSIKKRPKRMESEHTVSRRLRQPRSPLFSLLHALPKVFLSLHRSSKKSLVHHGHRLQRCPI